jgi:hypothetical protein
MKIKPTSVLCREADAREVASSYCNTRGVGEKRHALVARYLQLEGKLENGPLHVVGGFDMRAQQ